MLPWSVIPTAGWPSAAAVATTSAMRAAPSSIENSVWRCRWTNELDTMPFIHTLSTGACGESHGCSSSTLARATPGRHERDLHLRCGDRPVGSHELRLVRQRRVDEPDGRARGEHDVADAPVHRRHRVGAEPSFVEQLLASEH